MQTFTLECEVDARHGVVLRLPTSVSPGRHRLAVVVDPPQDSAEQTLNAKSPVPLGPIAACEPPRTDLWRRLEKLRCQAAQTGDLPAPMSWDAVLAATAQRRGEVDD